MKTAPLTSAIIGTLLGLLVWLAFFWPASGDAPPAPLDTSIAPGRPLGGDFTLQGADGTVALSDFRGKVVVIYFGYTYCPDVCPTALTTIAQALSALTPAELEDTRGIFISLDPQRDTMEVLKAYAPFFHANIVGASGSEAQVADVARRYGTSYMKQAANKDGLYTVDHTSYTYVVAANGTLAEILPHGTPPARLVEAIRTQLSNHAHAP